MKKRMFLTGILAMVLVFGLVLVGCDDGASSEEDTDPIAVDLSLPAIKDVPNFSGTFVSSQTEAETMVKDSFVGITGLLSGLTDVSSSSRSVHKSVQTEPISEIYDHDRTIVKGAEVTGYIQGNYTWSVADDDKPGQNNGDYQEISIKIKLAIDFDEVSANGFTIYGKYGFNEESYQKAQMQSPEEILVTMRQKLADGHIFSVSKNGKGLKFMIHLTASANYTGSVDDDMLDFDNYSFTIDIYDNNNEKKYSKSFDNPTDANAFLGA
jgi:hypothetical protein